MSNIGFPFLCGFILAFVMVAIASSSIMDDRIKAGIFDRNGVAYRIERVTP